jgi:GntR family transcriptional repressor for pyruvate dehydrogenase complex
MENFRKNIEMTDVEFLDLIERPKYRKRSDIIVQTIKQWIVNNGKKPGDNLPKEKKLMALFRASKGVIREMLKSMEV